MKKLIAIILLTLFVSPVYADQWCQWSGTEAENCYREYSVGIINVPGYFPIRTAGNESKINSRGYYHLTVIQPTIGADQIKDSVLWDFTDNEITKTWSVRDMTQQEIDERTAQPMPLSEYYLWKALIVTGTITQQQAAQNLPQELIDAYQARDALENPE